MNHQPLTAAELDRLAAFLDAIPAMSLESLDGYFAALICCQDPITPSAYLPEIWGEDFAFDSTEQATEILNLIVRHWNAIASELLHTLKEPHVYLPVLLEGDDGIARGNDWARGFMRAVRQRPASWRELLDDDERVGLLMPMMMLAHEHDPDPSLRPPPIDPDKREKALELMIASLPAIYRYFEPQRRALACASSPMPQRQGETESRAQRAVPVRQRSQVQALLRGQHADTALADRFEHENDARPPLPRPHPARPSPTSTRRAPPPTG